MTPEQVWLAVAGVVALAALTLALLESPVTDAPRPVVDGADASAYVITALDPHDTARDEPGAKPVAAPIDGRLFADIVARETVVTAASWTAGLRRALAPESRNRIRFHVRQETKRAGRERRAETKQALREFRARERAAAGRDGVGEDVA